MGCFSVDVGLSSLWARSVNLDVSCIRPCEVSPGLDDLYRHAAEGSCAGDTLLIHNSHEQAVVEQMLRTLGYEDLILERVSADLKSLGTSYFLEELRKRDTPLPKQAAFARFSTMLSSVMQLTPGFHEWRAHDSRVLELVRQLKIGVLSPILLPGPESLDRVVASAQAGHFCDPVEISQSDLESERFFPQQLLSLLRSGVAGMIQHRMTPAAVISEVALVLHAALDESLSPLDAQREALRQASEVRKSLYKASLTTALDPYRAPADYDETMQSFVGLQTHASVRCNVQPAQAASLSSEQLGHPAAMSTDLVPRPMCTAISDMYQWDLSCEPKRGAANLGALGPHWHGIGYKLMAKVDERYYSLLSGLRVEYEIGATYEDEAFHDRKSGFFFARTPFEATQAQMPRCVAGLQNAPQVILKCKCDGPFAIYGGGKFACSRLTLLQEWEESMVKPRDLSPTRVLSGQPIYRTSRQPRPMQPSRSAPISSWTPMSPARSTSRPQSAPSSRPSLPSRPASLPARPSSAPRMRGNSRAGSVVYGAAPLKQHKEQLVKEEKENLLFDVQHGVLPPACSEPSGDRHAWSSLEGAGNQS